MRPSPISLDAFAQPEKFFFPPRAYTSPDFHEFELDAVWRTQWVAVGRAEEVPNVGDYFTISIGPEPLIIIRDAPDAFIALSAVCRHRAMVVVEGSGHCKGRFVCPYHAWTYDRRGNLVGAPQMPAEFVKNAAGLARVRCETWQGIIFVSLNANIAPLAPRLASLEAIVAPWQVGELKNESVVDPNFKLRFDYPWNWKVYADGQNECYHCDKLHGDSLTVQQIDFGTMRLLVDKPDKGVFSYCMRTKNKDNTLNHTGQAILPPISSLSEEDRWMSISINIAPNIFMQLMADAVILLMWFPSSAETMFIKRHRLYPESTLALPDFLKIREPERAAARYFVGQDDEAFERVQRGLRSQFAVRGPIGEREMVLPGFNSWLLDRYHDAESRAGQ